MLPFLLTFDTPEETDKFEKMYIKTNKLLYGYAVDILGDSGLAEDAVQDTFIRLSRNLNKIDDPNCKESINFMITIVKNVSLTMLKDRNRKQVTYLDGDDELLPCYEPTPQDYCIKRERYELLHDAVNMLSDSYRNIILLRYYNDLSEAEIADILKITENNTSVRLHRARSQIVKNLNELEALKNE